MFTTLKRVVYPVPDMEQAKQWYSRILNAKPLFESPFASVYRVGNCSLSLAKSKENPPADPAHRVEVYWEVDDIDKVYAFLLRQGARELSPITEGFHVRIAKVLDPFGNVLGLSGKAAQEDSGPVEQQPSKTAMTVALCRALAAKEDRPEIRGPDTMAELFLSDKAKGVLLDDASRQRTLGNVLFSSLYGYITARTAYLDSVFQDACQKGLPQIVLLGAGYDSRPYRFSKLIAQATTIFEVDAPTTQRRKTEILQKTGIAIPPFVRLVPVNFKDQILPDALSLAGFNAHKETLFIWEGVTYYLPRPAVDATLAFIANYSPAQSRVCFDFMTRQLESVNAGEPFLSWIPEDQIQGVLSAHNMKILEMIDSSEMEKRYLTLGDGSRAMPAIGTFCIALAAVNPSAAE
jgi:methyltransferase (TIGR00027 family)